MAQDAELKLKVSLDLAFFRQQLSTIGTQLGGQSVPIAIRFDKKAIADQYRLLDRYIRGKKFTVELNLVGGLTKNEFDKIKGRLDDLRALRKVEIPVGIKNGATGKDVDKVVASIKERLAKNQQIKQDGGKLRIETSVKPSITNQDIVDFKKTVKDKLSKIGALEIPTKLDVPKVEDLLKALQKNINRQKPLLAKTSIKPSILSADVKSFKKEVESKLSGITVKVKAELQGISGQSFSEGPHGQAGLYEYFRTQGMSGGNMPGATEVGRSERLRKALEERTVKQLKDLAAKQGIGGVSKLNKDPLIAKLVAELSQDIAENLLGNIKNQMRDAGKTPIRRSFLDQIARAVLYMAGVDPASIRAQQAERRRIPAINWSATVPPVQPVSTRTTMALTGRTFNQLPGTAYGEQKRLVGNILNEGLKDALRNAANAFVDSVRDGLNAAIRAVQVRDLGNAGRPMLGAGRVAGLLTPFAGREPQRYSGGGESREQMMARRTAEAYARSALRGVSVMSERQPALPGTTFMGDAFVSGGGRDRVTGSGQAPERGGALAFPGGAMGRATQLPSSYLALGKASAELKKFEGFFNTNKLPLAGAIEELAGEFGNATKQVLLYGTAYKALAFFMDLPNQALNAAKSLQTFNNQLNAITGSSENADRAFTFVDNLAARFNVPLESARQGFVKLYASMAPAGFSSGEIENLFTGISKASATLGLSSDKVDRITYAFSQMASKGQLMSEEVSGQLGDVIPGALSIMAEAARMDIATFKKAMEDGVFVGETFKQVMSNVPIVLENRFGKGAAGAAKTLQGSMNALAISTQKFYESFEPIVSMGAASVFPIIATAISDATQAVQAFTTAMQGNTTPAQMLEGNAAQIYGVLQQLREIFTAIANVIQGLTPTLMIVGKAFLTTAEYIAKLVNTPIGGFLADLAVKAGIALIAVQLFAKTGIAGLISQLILLQRSTAAAGGGLFTFASTLTKTATAAKLFRLAITGLVGAGILFGIEALVNAIGRIANRLSDARKNAIAARDAIKSMSSAELGEQIIIQQNKLQALSRVQKAGGKVGSTKDRQILEQMGMKVTPTGGTFVGGQLIGGQYAVDKNLIESFRIREQEQLKAIEDQRKSLYDTTPLLLNEVELGAGKGSDKELNKAAEDARKLADDRRKYEADLMKLNAQQAIELDSMYFEQWKTLQDKKFDYMDAGQNEWMKREIKFQRDLQAIELRRIEAVFRAQSASRKAEIDAESAAYAGGGATGATGLLQGSTGISSGPHFDVRRADGSRISEAEARALFDSTIRRQLQMTSGYGPRRAPTRGASTFHRGIDLAGPANTPLNLAPGYSLQGAGMQGGLGYTANVRGPQGQMYQVGHLQQPGGNLPASRVRKEAKQDYSANLATQEAINAKQREALSILHANQQAQQEINILIREYVASIAPVEQQKLENSLLQDRINLIVGGLSGEALDTEIAISKARKQSALGIEEAKKAITEYEGKIEDVNQAVKDKKITTDEAAESVQNYRNAIANNERKIKELTVATQEYLPLLREQLHLAQQAAEAELRGSITRATPLGGTGFAGGFIGDAGAKFEEALSRGASKEEATRFAELQNQLTLLETRNAAIKSSVLAIGDAFATAMTTGVASLVDGTASAEEVFANFLSGVGQALIQAAQQMIATYIAIGIARIFAGLGGSLGGAQTNLQGTGALSTGSVGNIAGGNLSGLPTSYGPSALGSMGGGGGFGGFVGGAFGFANGGIVTGPTLGLVGEGKYNEAIVPLPDGRSIPVQLQDGSIRDKMGSDMAGTAGSQMLSMSFQSTTINGVEYVDRAQLEAAMAETRRISVREGATRGATIALDKLANSPSSRRRVGLR